MLCVAKVRDGGHAYYFEAVDAGVEAPGEWLSLGARRLGLTGMVAARDLEAVLSGADPTTGAVLGRSRARVTVAGFDLTFCAPKSVSMLHALADDDVAAEVQAGHGEAVRAAFSYVERRALAVRPRLGGERRLEPAEGVTGAAFVHRTSRALDPHLHSHVVLANIGRDTARSWRALDGRGIYAHAPTASALYHTQLRHELTRRIGVEWGPLDRGRADLEGIGPGERRAFSRRAAAIETHLAGRGLRSARAGAGVGVDGGPAAGAPSWPGPSGRARAVAAFATRAPRDLAVSADTLRASWRRRAADVGLSPRRLEALIGQVRTAAPWDETTERRGALEDAAWGLLARRGNVTRRDLVRTWSGLLARGAPAKNVERAAEEQIARLEPVEGPAGDRDGPGVGERRHLPLVRVLDPAAERGGPAWDPRDTSTSPDRRGPEARIAREALAERRRIDRMLAARGTARADDLTRVLDHDMGPDLGL